MLAVCYYCIWFGGLGCLLMWFVVRFIVCICADLLVCLCWMQFVCWCACDSLIDSVIWLVALCVCGLLPVGFVCCLVWLLLIVLWHVVFLCGCLDWFLLAGFAFGGEFGLLVVVYVVLRCWIIVWCCGFAWCFWWD